MSLSVIKTAILLVCWIAFFFFCLYGLMITLEVAQSVIGNTAKVILGIASFSLLMVLWGAYLCIDVGVKLQDQLKGGHPSHQEKFELM